jgi:hypothetical protein
MGLDIGQNAVYQLVFLDHAGGVATALLGGRAVILSSQTITYYMAKSLAKHKKV